MNKDLAIGLILALIIIAAGLVLWPSGFSTIEIGQGQWQIEVADEEEEQRQGLSGRQSLPTGQGMLFIYAQPGNYGFWMKDMNFPLDFVWISSDRVAGVTENVSPTQFTTYDVVNLPLYYPPEAVNKVLEINAGQVEKFGIKAGDKVVVKLKR